MAEFFFVLTVFLLLILMFGMGHEFGTYQTTKDLRNYRLTMAEDENEKKRINFTYEDELRSLKGNIICMVGLSIIFIFVLFINCVAIKQTAMEKLMKGEYKVEKILKYKITDNDTTAVDTTYNFYKAK